MIELTSGQLQLSVRLGLPGCYWPSTGLSSFIGVVVVFFYCLGVVVLAAT